MKCAGSNTNDTNTQSGMQKGLVEIAPFVKRHSAIFPGLAVKDQIRERNGTANDCGTIEQFLRQVLRGALSHAVCRLNICALEGALEGLARLLERRLLCRLLEGAILMEESDRRVRRLRELFD